MLQIIVVSLIGGFLVGIFVALIIQKIREVLADRRSQNAQDKIKLHNAIHSIDILRDRIEYIERKLDNMGDK